jgi:hypothetical protein
MAEQQQMQPQPTAVNPDLICQQAMQARMAAYEANEHFESVLKVYNDQVAALIGVVGIMKRRIMELEGREGQQAAAAVPRV